MLRLILMGPSNAQNTEGATQREPQEFLYVFILILIIFIYVEPAVDGDRSEGVFFQLNYIIISPCSLFAVFFCNLE